MIVGLGLLAASAVTLIAGAELFTGNAAAAARGLRITVLGAALLLAGADPEEMITAMIASGRHRPGLAAGGHPDDADAGARSGRAVPPAAVRRGPRVCALVGTRGRARRGRVRSHRPAGRRPAAGGLAGRGCAACSRHDRGVAGARMASDAAWGVGDRGGRGGRVGRLKRDRHAGGRGAGQAAGRGRPGRGDRRSRAPGRFAGRHTPRQAGPAGRRVAARRLRGMGHGRLVH